jgi:hypothetical protein
MKKQYLTGLKKTCQEIAGNEGFNFTKVKELW